MIAHNRKGLSWEDKYWLFKKAYYIHEVRMEREAHERELQWLQQLERVLDAKCLTCPAR